MKRLISLLLTCLLFPVNIQAGTICLNIKVNRSNLFPVFVKELKRYSKEHYDLKEFTTTPKHYMIKGERVFKIKRRRRPLIGTPTQKFKRKPKWKKEKIDIQGKITKDKVCIKVSLSAYNKRKKKWYTLESDNLLEEHMASFVLTNALKGKDYWSIGNPIISNNGENKHFLNLTKFKIDSVTISIDPSTGIKSVNFYLIKNNDVLTYRVLMLDNIKTINDALKVFNNHFINFNPKKRVARVYNFYWEYAKHGKIMDGMHKLQVITALGFPDKVLKNNKKNKIFVYNFDGKTYKYRIVNDELSLPDE